MATQSKKRTSEKSPDRNSLGRFAKLALIGLVAVLVLGATGVVVWRRVITPIRQHRMIERGRTLIEAKDLKQAELAVARALQLNPKDPVATRLMLQLAESAGSKNALYWYKSISFLEPGVVENHLAWARAALKFNEVSVAEQALQGVSEAGRQTAEYHDLMGQIAQASGQLPNAEAHFAAAVQREPNNEEYQLHLGVLHLRLPDQTLRANAQTAMERLAANPKYFRTASRALLENALEAKEWDKALSLAKQLQGAPGAPFEDRLHYLALLRRFQRPEFYSYLSEVEEISTANPENVGALISWLNSNGLVLIAVDWSKRLPEDLKSKMPVPAAIGESYATQLDWETLLPLVTDTNWEYADFLRLAFLARVQREKGDERAALNSWHAAVQACMDHPERYIMLARYATSWGWEEEIRDLLWIVARGSTNQQWAMDALFQYYLNKRDSGGLLNISNRMLEVNPQNTAAMNNVVLLSLLRSTNIDQSISMATTAYNKEPTNAGLASTYAFALHLQGKTEDGLKILRGLGEKALEDPSFAAYFGLLLVEGGKPDEARKYLEIAKGGKLLPEEEALVNKALEKLRGKSG
jgi:tetratricopeptide (TPR) repeat protein